MAAVPRALARACAAAGTARIHNHPRTHARIYTYTHILHTRPRLSQRIASSREASPDANQQPNNLALAGDWRAPVPANYQQQSIMAPRECRRYRPAAPAPPPPPLLSPPPPPSPSSSPPTSPSLLRIISSLTLSAPSQFYLSPSFRRCPRQQLNPF